MSLKQLAIVAGGKGLRLKDKLGGLPKPMIPIAGKPLLEHQIELAHRYGFNDLIVFACHGAEVIQQHLGNGSRWGVRIRYVLEKDKPLGTAGAVLAGLPFLAERFLAIYGDVMLNVQLDRIWQAHSEHRADVTLLVHPNDHPLDSDLVETNAEGLITAFHNRPHPVSHWFQNLVSTGLYVLERRVLQPFAGSSSPIDFGQELFPKLLQMGYKFKAYSSPEYIKDIGTPLRYEQVVDEYTTGVVERGSLATPQRAVFLDQDGTLIRDCDGLRSAEQLRLLPGVGPAVRALNHHGWRAVVVTNQPVIAKGWCSEAEMHRIHNKLETQLAGYHAFLDRIYYCPHHPEIGFPGERRDLKIQCDCRKPSPGMIHRAAADFNLDLPRSWLIGDTTRDLQTAVNAGLRSVLVRPGSASKDVDYQAHADFVFDTLAQAVDFILQNPEFERLHK